MVRNKLWRNASYAVGLSKQKKARLACVADGNDGSKNDSKNRQAKHDSHWSIVVVVDLQSLALTSTSFNDLPFLYERIGLDWIGL